MIDLHTAPTPNGWKVSIMLEECALPYTVSWVNLGKGEQFKDDFLAISPNNRIPAIVDRDPEGGGQPVSVFETGAILVYLAEKTGRFLPASGRARKAVLEWLFWQVGGLGPMLGQHGHFKLYAPDRIAYATERYRNETLRLYKVLNGQLAEHDHVAGQDYSIADMACFPWVQTYKAQEIPIDEFPDLKRWYKGSQGTTGSAARHGRGARPHQSAAAGRSGGARDPVRHQKGLTHGPCRILLRPVLALDEARVPQHPADRARDGLDDRLDPFLVGGVFNAVNNSVYAGRADPDAPKNRNTSKWLKDWARLANVTMNFPSRHHPLKSVHAMRFCCALEDDQTRCSGSRPRRSRPISRKRRTSTIRRCSPMSPTPAAWMARDSCVDPRTQT